MKVKWNRNLDGNSIIDPNESLSDYKGVVTTGSTIEEKSTIPMRSKTRDSASKSNRESSGCNLIFGPTRKSSSHRSTSTSSTISSSSSNTSSSTPSPTTVQQSTEQSPSVPTVNGHSSDRTTMTKLSNFLGIFKLNPSSSSSTNGSIKSSKSTSHPTSIKVVRRGGGNGKNSPENEGLFRTDSRRRRRANNLLQRNSDIRRSWNAAITGRNDPGIRSSWNRPSSPTYRPTNGNSYRSISPSIVSNQPTSLPGVNGVNGSSRASSLDGSGHFGNSCKVNSMPAPIVTLPECCLEGSDSETGLESKPGSPEDLEAKQTNGSLDYNEDTSVINGCDEVDKSNFDKVNKNGSVIRPSGPPPPPPNSTSTSVSLDGSVRSSDDVFIQVQITASSKCKTSSGYTEKISHSKKLTNGRLTGKQQQVQPANGLIIAGKPNDVLVDESDRPLSPIYESCTEKVNYTESLSPTGSLVDSRADSRSSNEDVNTILRPPSSTGSGSSSSHEMTLSEDGGLGESVSYDASSGCSWETSSLLTGSVCLSPGSGIDGHSVGEIMSPSSPSSSPSPISASTPHNNHHSHLHDNREYVSSPIMISDPMYNNNNENNNCNTNGGETRNPNDDNSYLYEPRISEVIRVTVKKAEMPEVVTLRSEDIIDLDSTGSTEENSPSSPSSASSFSSSSISSVHSRIHSTNGRKGNRTGILKDSNCLNANGLHNCRSSTPKKVHFAESAKVRSAASMSTSVTGSSPLPNNISDPNQQHQHHHHHIHSSSNSYDRSSPLPPPLNYSNGVLSVPNATTKADLGSISANNKSSTKLFNNVDQQHQHQLANNNETTTITTSSTVTIKKPSSSSRRLFQSSLNQNSLDDPDITIKNAISNKAQCYQPTGADDYSSEQIISTQFNPESFYLSNQSSLVSSTSSSSSPSTLSSLPSNNQARALEGITNSKSSEGRGAVKPVAPENDDSIDNNNTFSEINHGSGQSVNSKSQVSKSSLHNVATINSTSSVAHVLNQNTNNSTVSLTTKTSTTTLTNANNNGPTSGFPYLSRELDAHRKLSALHQRKLIIAREESARSSLIIQGLGVVVQRLTQQLDSMNGPSLRSQLSQVQNNFDQLDAQFKSQEEALKLLQFNYHKDQSELREEVKRLTYELADEERRHEREKADLINSFELELDAARRQFTEELTKVEEVKNDLKSLAEQLKAELRAKVEEITQAKDRMNQLEKVTKRDQEGRARRAEERVSYLCKEIQSLKDVLELKEKDLKRLRTQAERDEGLSRDLARAQSTIDVLRQRLEQLEIARNSQADAMSKLKAENEALIDEIVRDQREMDKIALRKEELEYTLYNMVTIGADDGYLENKSSRTPYEYVDEVSYTQVDHPPTMMNGESNMINGHSDSQGKGKARGRKTMSSKELRSLFVSSMEPSVSSSSSTTVRIEKNLNSNDRRLKTDSYEAHNVEKNGLSSKYSPDMINDSGFEDISIFMRTNA